MQSRDASLRVFLDSPLDIGGAAISGIGIGDDRNFDGAYHVARMRRHFGLSEKPDVRSSEAARGGAESGHVDRRKTRRLDEPRRQRVRRAGCLHDPAAAKKIAQRIHL
jgi:hypothetical protein